MIRVYDARLIVFWGAHLVEATGPVPLYSGIDRLPRGSGPFPADEAVFSDPTAEPLTGREITYRGADEIVEGFRSAAENAGDLGFDLVEVFDSGQWAVLKVRYRSSLVGEAFGRPGASIPIEIDAVTILRIVDGRVAEHLDHVDYDAMLEQVRAYEPAG